MKITQEDYAALENQINIFLAGFDNTVILEHRQNVGYAKNQFVAFCWDVYFAATHGTDTCHRLRAYLNDSHIETILKAILIKYK